MTRALSASAQGCLSGFCLAGALLLVSAPALRAGTSTQKNPVATFSTPGLKQVTLQACNAGGCTSITKSVTVLDPMPAVTSTTLLPAGAAEVGQLVIVTGTGTGKPPLTYTWLFSAGGPPFLGLPGPSVWWNTAGMPAGGYLLSLQIQNSAGSITSTPLYLALSPATPLDLYTTTPCRIYDSRQGPGPLVSAVTRILPGTGACGVPAGARALAANVTVISPTGSGYVTFFPGNYPQPSTTMISFSAGDTRSNHMILPLATTGGGTFAALASIAGNGNVQLVIDVSGYYAPAL
jgi:PKD repeat protein